MHLSPSLGSMHSSPPKNAMLCKSSSWSLKPQAQASAQKSRREHTHTQKKKKQALIMRTKQTERQDAERRKREIKRKKKGTSSLPTTCRRCVARQTHTRYPPWSSMDMDTSIIPIPMERKRMKKTPHHTAHYATPTIPSHPIHQSQ